MNLQVIFLQLNSLSFSFVTYFYFILYNLNVYYMFHYFYDIYVYIKIVPLIQGWHKLDGQFRDWIICKIIIVKYQFNGRFLIQYHKFADVILKSLVFYSQCLSQFWLIWRCCSIVTTITRPFTSRFQCRVLLKFAAYKIQS